jgi:hypothetical protein
MEIELAAVNVKGGLSWGLIYWDTDTKSLGNKVCILNLISNSRDSQGKITWSYRYSSPSETSNTLRNTRCSTQGLKILTDLRLSQCEVMKKITKHITQHK